MRKHKDVRVLRKVTNKMTSAKNRPERFFVSEANPKGAYQDDTRKTRGTVGEDISISLSPKKRDHAQAQLKLMRTETHRNEKPCTRKRNIAQQRTTVFMHRANPKEIPECGYFLCRAKARRKYAV